MKKVKRLLCSLLAMVLVLTIFPANATYAASKSTEAGYSYDITRNSSIPDYWVVSTPSSTIATYAKSTINSRDISGYLNDYKSAVDALATAETNYKKAYTKAVISAVGTLIKLGINPVGTAAKVILALVPGVNVLTVTEAYQAYQGIQNKKANCESAFNAIPCIISR